jgi:SNF2 family DNA or RNA helicase
MPSGKPVIDLPDEIMKPLPDQQVAIDKLSKVPSRLCGDSMGVGKTVTGIGLDFRLREERPDLERYPTLIVSEKIGIDVWYWHLRAMGVPDEQILLINPADRTEFILEIGKQEMYQRSKFKLARPRYRYYVCHYNAIYLMPELTGSVGKKPKLQWAHVIGDEIHLIKTRTTRTSKAMKRIQTYYKTGLSGTPADDKPQDLWSILNWLYPKKYTAYWRFFDEYLEWEEGYTGYRKIKGVKNMDKLHKEIEPFYIRRLLTDVVKDMPQKIHVMPPIITHMAPRERKAYESMRDKMLAKIGSDTSNFILSSPAIVGVITRLQQMCLATLAPQWKVPDEDWALSDEDDPDWDLPEIVLTRPSPKLDAVMDMLKRHEEEAFVIFTQFRGMADLIEEECLTQGITVVKITGAISRKEERTERVRQFQEGKARVFVGTIAAAGKSITLTRSHHAIFTDLSWNPSKNEQAEDRLWRRNQPNAVRIYTIQEEDSIDQVRWDRIKEKAQWIEAVMNPRGSLKKKSTDVGVKRA